MISIDDHPPPDPPSSDHHYHHQEEQISHDPVSDIDLKASDADLDDTIDNPLPSFSIRDYVFSLRSKNVARNWPFSQTSLQLCLKHGVKNLLPPFQSLDLLRDNSYVCSHEEIVSRFDGKPTGDRVKSGPKSLALESISTNSSGSKRDNEEHFAHTKSKKNPTTQTAIKRSRSVMKLNSNLNPGVEPAEEIAPNSFIVSETMASKVCPVCKTFSSSSNTTLNAHIDQCLSGESSMKWTANPKVIVKHRIKPRKTRLMVDIYETAPRCTVEELDRRNGTSWATNSSFPAQEFEFQGEEKEEPQTTIVNPEVADHEGDVYIDNDGTKVRILSVPKTSLSDNHGAPKLLKGVKGSKIVVGKKKKTKHHRKYLKLSSPKPHRGVSEAGKGGEEDVAAINGESCGKDERGKAPMKARVHMKMDDLVIVRPPWACSKRTGLVKKDRKPGLHRPIKDRVFESDKSSSGSGSRTLSSSDNIGSSQSSKKMRISSPLKGHLYPLTINEGREGPKFSSLKKNVSIPAAKLNLKRKFSAFKKSRVLCLSTEKMAVGPSQDSSNEQSRMEEDDLDEKKNEKTGVFEEERSFTSKSLNEESLATDDQSDRDIVPAPEGSFMGLSNSFDPEFSKLVGQPNDKFDSQECIKLYQDQLCSTNRAPDGKNIFGNDIEKNGNYFQEVDPIPIPGPPGSFLPSPGGDMVSEELHSSLTTTSRVQSGENQHHHDTMDRDSMSNSPISTVSNPSLARSDSKSSEKLAERSTSVQEDTRPGSSAATMVGAATYKKSFPVSSAASFKNDQPCCCSRKEGASNYQESSLLRKGAAESNKIPGNLNFRSDMFSISNYPISSLPASDQASIFPTTKKSPAIKLPVYSDCESAASLSKPVLRLMGKNLTVVQTDGYPQSSQPVRTVPSSSDHISFAHGYPQSPVVFSPYQNGSESQRFNAHPSNDTRNHVNPRHVHGGFMPSVDRYGPYMGPTMARSHQVVYNAATKPINEIIIIDDTPENEADDAMHNERMRRIQAPMNYPLYTMYQSQASAHPYGGGSLVFRGGDGGGSPVFHGGGGGGFQTSMGNGNLGKWNCTPAATGSSAAYYPPNYP